MRIWSSLDWFGNVVFDLICKVGVDLKSKWVFSSSSPELDRINFQKWFLVFPDGNLSHLSLSSMALFFPGQSTTFSELASNCSWNKAKGNSGPNCYKGGCQSWYIVGVQIFSAYLYLIYIFFLQFPLSDFVVMLFHYDGVVDKWRDLSWSDSAIHVSAVNQTKW
jgi:hypothetical protein